MNDSTSRVRTRRALLLVVSALVLTAAGACGILDEERPETAEAVAEDAVATAEEVLAQERARAEAAAAAAAEAEAEAQALQEQLARAEEELERQRAEQAAREQRLREQKALEAERARLAEQRAEQERLMAQREAELQAREAELAAQREAEALEAERRAAEARATEEGFRAKAEPDYVQATLRPGTILQIEILETLSSGTNRVGDRFVSHVASDIYTEDGILAVPAGSEVRGRVIEATPLKRIGGQASLAVEFTELVPPIGPPIGLKASFTELGEDQRKDKRKIIGAAVAGAILGRVLGGSGAGEVLAGAAVGAAAGAAVVARSEGQEAEIPAGQVVGLVLEEVVTVTTEMTGVVE